MRHLTVRGFTTLISAMVLAVAGCAVEPDVESPAPTDEATGTAESAMQANCGTDCLKAYFRCNKLTTQSSLCTRDYDACTERCTRPHGIGDDPFGFIP